MLLQQQQQEKWKGFLDLISCALKQLPLLSHPPVYRVLDKKVRDYQRGAYIEYKKYSRWTTERVEGYVCEVRNSRGYSLEKFDCSEKFKGAIVMLPGKFTVLGVRQESKGAVLQLQQG